MNKLETDNRVNKLNDKIKHEGIIKIIRKLKNGKSAADDCISNEMLKKRMAFQYSTTDKPLEKLFNFIFENGKFPNIWNESLLVPLHKKGNKIDPSNYRCISISSNLGKVFNRVIHTRLLQFIEKSKIISKNQICFMEKSRTADYVFLLNSIIDSYKQKKKKRVELLTISFC